jgi:hypothetical protein
MPKCAIKRSHNIKGIKALEHRGVYIKAVAGDGIFEDT